MSLGLHDGGGNARFRDKMESPRPLGHASIQDREPSVSVFYIHVATSVESALKGSFFMDTYEQHPPGYPHTLVLVSNGGQPHPTVRQRFEKNGAQVVSRSNDGWDIGAYLELAQHLNEDLMVCFGESVHFHKPGWLRRIAQAWQKTGPGMYGTLASFMVRPHLNTSAFACSPTFMRDYPKVSSRQERYDFEHGHMALWVRIANLGYPTKLVTWDGEYDPVEWRRPANGLWKGDQSNCLVFCNHTDRYTESNDPSRQAWGRGADGLGFGVQRLDKHGFPALIVA